MLRPTFHEVQVLRPEERCLDLAGQIHRSPGHTVHADRLDGPFGAVGDFQGELQAPAGAVHHRLDARLGSGGADQVGFPT